MKGVRKKLIGVVLPLDDIKAAGYEVPMSADCGEDQLPSEGYLCSWCQPSSSRRQTEPLSAYLHAVADVSWNLRNREGFQKTLAYIDSGPKAITENSVLNQYELS
jgi:hypothetical protein